MENTSMLRMEESREGSLFFELNHWSNVEKEKGRKDEEDRIPSRCLFFVAPTTFLASFQPACWATASLTCSPTHYYVWPKALPHLTARFVWCRWGDVYEGCRSEWLESMEESFFNSSIYVLITLIILTLEHRKIADSLHGPRSKR